MDGPPGRIFALTDVFPAFRTALNASTEWPGVLLWTQGGDSVFLAVSDESIPELRRQVQWIFSQLATTIGVDLATLQERYRKEFGIGQAPEGSRVTILHLSDIHLGSREARLRLPRVQDLLTNLGSDLGESGEAVIPLISGDLMDSPAEENLDQVRAFLSTLRTLGTEKPVIVLGNDDVRRDGDLLMPLRRRCRSSRILTLFGGLISTALGSLVLTLSVAADLLGANW